MKTRTKGSLQKEELHKTGLNLAGCEHQPKLSSMADGQQDFHLCTPRDLNLEPFIEGSSILQIVLDLDSRFPVSYSRKV